MRKMILFIFATVVLLLCNSAFAAKVNKVELNYKDGFTIARIDVEGIVRFSHQTEIAKDGKPYRVIVDVLSATHNLGAKVFTNLPPCPVKSIRSSQYSVTPEKVVRIVFDMDSERIYRIDSDNKSITLTFSDKGTKQFPVWATTGFVKKQQPAPAKKKVMASTKTEKSVKQINNTINEDRMLSLEGAKKTVTDTKQKVVAKKEVSKSQPVKKTTVVKVDSSPKPEVKKPVKPTTQTFASKLEGDKFSQASKPKSTITPKAKPEVKKEVVKVTTPKKQPVKKVVAQTKPQPQKIVAKKETAKVAAPKKQPVKKVVVQTKPKAKKKVAKVDKKQDKKATSRFRRSPVKSKKIKGTMVAEFPKRLVIKYKAKRYRDPFETLINENKNYNNPVERRVPNVEGLKLVGVIDSEGEGNRALFEDNTGYGYILKTGDKVRKGYVLRVDTDRVYFQIFEYGWSRTVSLTLES